MTVKELIELLQKEDPKRLVIMSCDGEGNRYSPFSSATPCAYIEETSCFGETGLEKLTSELRLQGYTEEDVKGGVPALSLWPMN